MFPDHKSIVVIEKLPDRTFTGIVNYRGEPILRMDQKEKIGFVTFPDRSVEQNDDDYRA